MTSTTSLVGNVNLFTGQTLDPETGNYYYRLRYYSPVTGRFLTQDPAGYIGGPNMYAYVGNDPLNYADPFGLKEKNTQEKGAGGQGGATKALAPLVAVATTTTTTAPEAAWLEGITSHVKVGPASGTVVAAGVVMVAGGFGNGAIEGLSPWADQERGGPFAPRGRRPGDLTGGGPYAYWRQERQKRKGEYDSQHTESKEYVSPNDMTGGTRKLPPERKSFEGPTFEEWLKARRDAEAARGGNNCPPTGGGSKVAGGEEDGGKPPLKRIHPDSTLETPPYKASLDYWRKQPTEDIVKSLRPGEKEPLTVKPDGRIFQGNTRTKVLEERGYDINNLPREVIL